MLNALYPQRMEKEKKKMGVQENKKDQGILLKKSKKFKLPLIKDLRMRTT